MSKVKVIQRESSAARLRVVRRRAMIAVAILMACEPKSRAAPLAGQDASSWHDAVVAGVAAVRIDSLCSGHCAIAVIDTLVRSAPTRESLDIVGLPLLGYLSTTDLDVLGVRTIKLVSGSFVLRAAARDTVRIAASMVRATPLDKERIVLVSILLPGSLGLIAIVELRQDGSAWPVKRVRLIEA